MRSLTSLLPVFVIAAFVTAVTTPIAIKLAPKIGAMDIPKARGVHTVAKPRFGGMAIYLGILIGFMASRPLSEQAKGLLLGSTLIFALGVVDDIKGMSPKMKLLGQIACAVVAWFFTIQIKGFTNPLRIGPAYVAFPIWLSVMITIFWIVGITNTVNLIDGLDGLAGGITLIACLSIAYTAYIIGKPESAMLVLAIAGACFGFLLWNFYPSKIFMGDSGSLLLGYMLATVSMAGEYPTKGTTLFATLVPVLVLALPIFDTTFAIIRRLINHKPIMQADKGHLHHRIMAMGFGQRRTVLALYCIAAIMGVAGIVWTIGLRLEGTVLAIVAAMLITIFLGIGIVDKKIMPEDPGSDSADSDDAELTDEKPPTMEEIMASQHLDSLHSSESENE